jgi:hypothetical protein
VPAVIFVTCFLAVFLFRIDTWYQLASPNKLQSYRRRYRNGTTHLVIEPLDFMARLAALVPPPRMHLTRYHGV